jgi:IclR family KDG regulon transcriptional repressor
MGTGAIHDYSSTPRKGRFSISLCAGLSILTSFTAERPVRGIAEVAEDLDMGRSTIHRYATTLAALGFLEQGPSRKYRLAPRGADIGMAFLCSMPLRHAAREHLLWLRAETGHTVALAVSVGGGEILYVDQLQGHRRGQYEADLGSGVGTRAPADRTAAGMALLARSASASLADPAPGVTLLAELRAIDAGGRELRSGRHTLAAPVLDREDEAVAAIEVTVPVETAPREELTGAFGPRLRVAAERVAATLAERDRRRVARGQPRRALHEPLRGVGGERA